MQYHQDAKLKSNQKKRAITSGLQVKQIVFDKEITQQWKIDTDEPTELLPFSLKKVYLSRLCDFWHQIKFFYHENWEEFSKADIKTNNVKIQTQEVESYSSVEIFYSAQVIENCKRVSKVIWKIMRQRMLRCFNKIKEEADMEEEDQSVELEDEKLRSYMIFLKLQENKRIDLAIEIFDSVVEKNTRRKLLNAFLNMRERLKDARRKQTYRDRIKIECFAEIVMRNIRKLNSEVICESFCDMYEFSEGIRREEEYEAEEGKRKQYLSQKSHNSQHFKSVSNRKVVINDDYEQENIQKRDTVNKYNKHKREKNQKETRQNENHISTVKRQTQTQNEKQLFQNSHLNSMASDYHSNIKSSHEKIIHSHYYYDEEQHIDENGEEYEEQEVYRQRKGSSNLNSLPTRREIHTTRNYNTNVERNQFIISGIENNIQSQTLHQQKTVRTPSRSEVNKKSFVSNEFDYENRNQSYKGTRSHHNEDLHIPITQRTEKHYHEDNQEEEVEEEISDHHEDSTENIHQQICVIRNFATTPARKPDRYQKIPILSSNIQFRQFFLNSKEKKVTKHFESHSSSFYERKCCEGCQYCSRLQRVKQAVQKISKERMFGHSENVIIQNTVTKRQVFIENVFEKGKNSEQLNQTDSVGSQKFVKKSRREFDSMELDMQKINQSASKFEIPKIKYITNSLQRQSESQQMQKVEKRNYSPNSPMMTPVSDNLARPSSQVSAFMEGSRSKTPSARKIFKRKPMY